MINRRTKVHSATFRPRNAGRSESLQPLPCALASAVRHVKFIERQDWFSSSSRNPQFPNDARRSPGAAYPADSETEKTHPIKRTSLPLFSGLVTKLGLFCLMYMRITIDQQYHNMNDAMNHQYLC
jgi:hypothetical protein